MAEECGNCGRVIGKLETPFIFKSEVVCADCHARLVAGMNYQTTATAAREIPREPIPPQGSSDWVAASDERQTGAESLPDLAAAKASPSMPVDEESESGQSISDWAASNRKGQRFAPRRSGQISCPTCGHQVSMRARVCPQCAEPIGARLAARQVSRAAFLFFGCFYLLAMGWWRTAIVVFLLVVLAAIPYMIAVITVPIMWLILVATIPAMIEKIEAD